MREREPQKETIGKGELFFLHHPGTEETFSGFGLTTQSGTNKFLVGFLEIDHPTPVDPAWLKEVGATFGDYWLESFTETGDRAIACQMQIEPQSLVYLHQYPAEKTAAFQTFLQPLLEHPPNPAFTMRWDEEARLWRSELVPSAYVLPPEIRQVFERTGYGCLAAETNIGVMHVCHAPSTDIEGFFNKPVEYQWQLVKMPTAPLIRLQMTIVDNPTNPFRFESFLNIEDESQARVLAQLAHQDKLYLAFYGDGLTYRFTKIIKHDRQQWQYIDELVAEAIDHWGRVPPEKRDFDQAKAEFMKRFI